MSIVWKEIGGTSTPFTFINSETVTQLTQSTARTIDTKVFKNNSNKEITIKAYDGGQGATISVRGRNTDDPTEQELIDFKDLTNTDADYTFSLLDYEGKPYRYVHIEILSDSVSYDTVYMEIVNNESI